MRKYFAWMFFVAGSVNVVSEGVRHALGQASTFFAGPEEALRALLFIVITASFFWLWQRWK